MTQGWLSIIRPRRLSAQSTDARTPDTTSRRKRHQTQFNRLHRLSSATSRTWRSDLDNFHGHTYSPSNSNSSVDYAVRPQYHGLENTISRGTPTSRPVQSTNRIQLNADHSLSHTTTVLKVGLCHKTSRPRTPLVSHTHTAQRCHENSAALATDKQSSDSGWLEATIHRALRCKIRAYGRLPPLEPITALHLGGLNKWPNPVGWKIVERLDMCGLSRNYPNIYRYAFVRPCVITIRPSREQNLEFLLTNMIQTILHKACRV